MFSRRTHTSCPPTPLFPQLAGVHVTSSEKAEPYIMIQSVLIPRLRVTMIELPINQQLETISYEHCTSATFRPLSEGEPSRP